MTRFALLSLLLIPAIHALSLAQPTAKLNHLVEITPRKFSKVVRTDLPIQKPLSETSIRRKTFIHPQVLLGKHHCVAFVEETRRDRLTRNRPDPAKHGVRIVELKFTNTKNVVATELFKAVGDRALARNIRWTPETRTLVVNYWSKDLGRRFGQDIRIGNDLSGETIVREPEANDQELPVTPAWTIQRRGDGTLTLISNSKNSEDQPAESCKRVYHLRQNESGSFQIVSSITVGIGTQWSHTVADALDVPLTTQEQNQLHTTLTAVLPDNTNPYDTPYSTQGMLFIPFSSNATPSGTRGSLDLHAVAGLCIDLENMEATFLSQLIDSLIDAVRNLEKSTRSGIGDETLLSQFAILDANLVVAKVYAEKQKGNLGDRNIHDGIADTQSKLSTLAFQFPYSFEGNEYLISYSPGQNTLFVANPSPIWSTGSGRPLQFQAPNGKLHFAMRLHEKDQVRFDTEQHLQIRRSLAEEFGIQELQNAKVATRLPQGRLNVELGDDGSDANKIASLSPPSAGIDLSGSMILHFTASEADSFSLIDLYLRNRGLPVLLDVRSALTSSRDQSQRISPATIASTILADKDFDVVTESRKSIDVTVMADEAVFDHLKVDEVSVALCYADERTDRYRVKVTRDNPEAVVAMAVRTVGGRVEAGVNYSLDNEKWTLSEDGLYGFIYISE